MPAAHPIPNSNDIAISEPNPDLLLPPSLTTQTVREQDILHTTLARLVAPPGTAPDGTGPAARLHAAAEAMTRDLCGLQLTLDRLWWVPQGRL